MQATALDLRHSPVRSCAAASRRPAPWQGQHGDTAPQRTRRGCRERCRRAAAGRLPASRGTPPPDLIYELPPAAKHPCTGGYAAQLVRPLWLLLALGWQPPLVHMRSMQAERPSSERRCSTVTACLSCQRQAPMLCALVKKVKPIEPAASP